MSLIKSKSFKEWLISFGKTKANMLYTAYLIILITVLLVVNSLIFYHNFYGSFIANKSFILFGVVISSLNSLRFYDEAIAEIKYAEELKRKGLTRRDILNIEFVKKWEEMKANGFAKYIFFNGGLILGSGLFILVSFFMFPKAKPEGRQFEEFSDMLYFMLKCYIIGFLSGVLINLLIWNNNERRLKRLTNPID